jgi:Rho GDP-dissociation inhibitor
MEPEVKFHSIGIISDDFGEITTPLPIDDNQSGHVLFTLREGSHYRLKLTFSVLHNIVSGLTYTNTVWKGGLQGASFFKLQFIFFEMLQ